MLLGKQDRFLGLVAKLCILELVSWGVLYYAFAALWPSMQAELGWSTGVCVAGFSVALWISGFAAPLVGTWMDRHGSRGLMVCAALSGCLGVVLWSISYSHATYFSAWVLIGLGMAGTLYAPAFATIVRAMPQQSRQGILIVSVVGALASTIFYPVSSSLSDWLGWRSALLVLAIALATVTVPLALQMPHGQAIQGEVKAQHGTCKRQPRGQWRLALALMAADAGAAAFHTYVIFFLLAVGQPDHFAAGIAGLVGVAKVAGRIACSFVRDLSAMRLLRGSLFANSAGLFLPILWPSIWSALVMVFVVGATSGARTILRPAIVIEMAGTSQFGARNGFLQLLTTIAKGVGPMAGGIAIGAWGVRVGFGSAALLAALGGVILCRFPMEGPVQ